MTSEGSIDWLTSDKTICTKSTTDNNNILCSVISVILLCFGLISIVVNSLFLGTVIKYRREAYVKGPFFTLMISIILADQGQIISTWSLGRFWPYLLVFSTAFTFSWLFFIAQSLGIILLTIERFFRLATSIIRYERIWTKRRLGILIGLQWTLSVLIVLPTVFIELHQQQRHEKGSNFSVEFVKEEYYTNGTFINRTHAHYDVQLVFLEIYYSFGNFLFFMPICAILLPILLLFMFIKTYQHLSRDHDCCEYHNFVCQLNKTEFRLVAILSLILTHLALVYAAEFLTLVSLLPHPVFYQLIFDLFNGSKPVVFLLISSNFPAYFWRFFTCKPSMESDRRHSNIRQQQQENIDLSNTEHSAVRRQQVN